MNNFRHQSVLFSTPVRKKIPKFSSMGEVSTIQQTSKKSKSFLDLICEAIGSVGEPRKGASFQKIKSYILKDYDESDQKRANFHIKKSLIKGLEDGVLSRPAASKQKIGAVGYFVVKKASAAPSKKAKAQKAVSKPSEPKPRKTEENKIKKERKSGHLSDTEVSIIKNPKKNKKLHSSDSEMPEGKIIKPKQNRPKNILYANKRTPVLSKKGSKEVKKPNPVKLFADTKKEASKKLRMDVSDSEVEVKKTRKNLKSHSSDTEFETSRIRESNIDGKQQARKKNQVKPKLGTTVIKGKASKMKAPTEAKAKVQKAGTKVKKVNPKDSLELKEVKAEKTISKRGVK